MISFHVKNGATTSICVENGVVTSTICKHGALDKDDDVEPKGGPLMQAIYAT